MRKPSLTIRFDRANGVFYGGETVTGAVIVDVTEETKMLEIRMDIRGAAAVNWSDQSDSANEPHVGPTRHSASETYLAMTLTLHKGASHSSIQPPGSHSLPFQFTLSPSLPTSFESPIGHIRYVAKATIDRPGTLSSTTKRPFTVVSQLDLNRLLGTLTPVGAVERKSVGCLCCKSGPISVGLTLDRTGFVPGESIPIHAECVNNSNRKIRATRATLMRRIAYHTTTRTRHTTNVLVTMQRGGLNPGSRGTWRGDLLRIPPSPPSSLHGCRIIGIDYYVVVSLHLTFCLQPAAQFSADPAGLASALEAAVPVTIGTIPLVQAIDNDNFPSPLPSPFMAEYPSLPPPSYLSSINEKQNIRDEGDNEHTQGDLMFAPSYPYYNFVQPSAPSINEAD